MAVEDGGDGAGGRDRLVGGERQEARAEFTTPPRGMLVTQVQHLLLAGRRGVGPARLVGQRQLRRDPGQPFVTGFAADAELAAERRHIGVRLGRLMGKGMTQGHLG